MMFDVSVPLTELSSWLTIEHYSLVVEAPDGWHVFFQEKLPFTKTKEKGFTSYALQNPAKGARDFGRNSCSS
jgi:hypothetical protein